MTIWPWRREWLDAAILVWAVTWIVLGFRVAEEVRGLSELSGTVIEVGVGIESTGEALGSVRDAPIVGERVAEPSEDLTVAGRSAIASGRESRESIRSLSTLLGFAVAIIPTVPLLLVYLPTRLGWVQVTVRRRPT